MTYKASEHINIFNMYHKENELIKDILLIFSESESRSLYLRAKNKTNQRYYTSTHFIKSFLIPALQKLL